MFHFQDLASNSPYCLLYNSYIVTSENLLKTRDLFFPYLSGRQKEFRQVAR